MQEITLSRLMQLYIAAHQCKHIWREVWKFILPVLSFPIVQSVEEFVSRNRLNEAEIYKSLFFGG
eukprot:700420-Hanusia_phi.AAC.1